MKLLSIAIPCYNSAAYMRKCVDSLLPGGEDVEIIIVNDGSKDDTPVIAEEYRERFPSIVKVVNKENGGHGSAVNAGIEQASGLYFKVVDSDDWVSQSAYIQILNKLKELLRGGNSIDMFISNFVYEKEGEKRKKAIKYHHALPQDEIFTWKDVRHFRVGQYILMHSVIYRTKLLRDCGLKLPEHTFYVDNIFVFKPLPNVKTMFYMDVNFYRYFIGREDQSVNEQVMIGRIDQQIKGPLLPEEAGVHPASSDIPLQKPPADRDDFSGIENGPHAQAQAPRRYRAAPAPPAARSHHK